MNVLEFPNEIQEKILSYLDIAHLIAATRTCSLWKAVANKKLLKQWCLANISSDVFIEMTGSDAADQSANEEPNWEELCVRWAKTVAAATTTESPIAHVDLRLTAVTTSCISMAVSGDRLVVGDQSDHLVWYDRSGVELARISNHNRPVIGIGLLDIGLDRTTDDTVAVDWPHDAVIALTTGFLAIYATPKGDCRQLYLSEESPVAGLVSVQGQRFSHCDRLGKSVTVSQVSVDHSDVTKVVVKVAHQFRSEQRVLNWKLWRDTLVCLLQNGTVMTRHLASGRSTCSATISDFLYPYESFMYRGLILCNISTARTLLNYWHINMGLPHWLVSADGLHFTRVNTQYPFDDEMTTVCIRGTAIVVGTRRGHLCFYSYKGDDRNVPCLSFEKPILVCKIADAPIYKCDFSTEGQDFVVYAKTALNTVLLVTLPLVENYRIESRHFTTHRFINS